MVFPFHQDGIVIPSVWFNHSIMMVLQFHLNGITPAAAKAKHSKAEVQITCRWAHHRQAHRKQQNHHAPVSAAALPRQQSVTLTTIPIHRLRLSSRCGIEDTNRSNPHITQNDITPIIKGVNIKNESSFGRLAFSPFFGFFFCDGSLPDCRETRAESFV